MSDKPKRTRCPNGSRKDKRSGECVKKGERGPQKKIKIFRKQNKNLIRDYKMSSETRENYENALDSLKRSQIVDLFKKIRNVLELNVGKKNKNVLVKEIMDLHGSGSRPNMFNGKQLLSFEKDSHIKIPRRETREEGRRAKAEKQSKAVDAKKKALDAQINASKRKIEELTKQQKATALKILNEEKREKARQVKGRERARKFASFKEAIEDLKRRNKGASKETRDQLQKELIELKKSMAEAKK
tara:strand:+ start:244 stop:972 length:729 start_codon:yes stop_codon:yes gene_type:complete